MRDRIPEDNDTPLEDQEEKEEEVVYPETDDDLDVVSDAESANGQPDEEVELPAYVPPGVLVLRPSVVMTSCAACPRTVSIGVLGTRDGILLVDTLILSNRISLLCDPCLQEIRNERLI